MKVIKTFSHITLITIVLAFSACTRKEKEFSTAQIEESITEQVAIAKEYLSEEKNSQAISLLEDLQQQYPENITLLEALAFAYIDNGDPGLAALYFEQIVKNDPILHEHRIFAAQAYVETKGYSDASRNYENFLEHFPNDRSTWKALAKVYEADKKDRKALEAYLKAEELTKYASSEEEALKIAQLSQKLGDPQEAKTWNHLALTQNPKSTEALSRLLKTAIQEEDWSNVSHYIKSLEEAPAEEQDKALLKLAKKLLSSPKIVQEKKALVRKNAKEKQQEALKEFKSYLAKANKHRAEGDFEGSIDFYKKALDISKKPAIAWDGLSQAYFGNKDYANAEMAGQEAVRRKGDELGYTFNYLKAIKANGSTRKLITELRRAKGRFPHSADITLTLAKTYHKMANDTTRAKNYYKEFLKQSPQHPKSAQVEEILKSI